MFMRKLAAAAILILLASCLGGIGTGQSLAGASPEGEKAASPPERQILVYYFHGDVRCKTCRAIEEYAHEALEAGFGAELKSGAVAWKAVNTDEEKNSHFIRDFELVSSSLVLVEAKGGKPIRHKVLQEAWTLVRTKDRFVSYVQTAVREFLS